ncbi:PFL-like glycyl radical enzyme [Neocallimastix sp. 'constans']
MLISRPPYKSVIFRKIKSEMKDEDLSETINLEISISLDSDFIDLINNDPKEELNNDTWKQLLSIEGLGLDNLDIMRCYHDIVNYGFDKSINSNSNFTTDKFKFYSKEIHESLAPQQKLINVSQFFVHVKQLYGAEKAKDLFRAWICGDNYLHDSCYLFVPYCYAMSVEPLIKHGIIFNKQLNSFPPKHARSFIGQVAETITSMSQELSGAIALPDIFTYYVYFLQMKGIETLEGNEKIIFEVENDFQSLIHILNSSYRANGQSAYTNITVYDMPCLEYLFGKLYFPNGSQPNLKLVMEVQKIFCNWFARGQLEDQFLPYPFPVVTLNLKVNERQEIMDQETFKYFCEINLNGVFNFFIIDSNNALASYDHVVNNHNARMSVFGEGGVNIGSLKVVTVNLARIGKIVAKENKNINDFYKKLDEQLDKTYHMLLAHRDFIKLQITRGACPFFNEQLGFMFLERFFLTFGIIGLYEGLMEMGYNILEKDGLENAHQILKYINDYANSKCDPRENILFNVEQIPSESLAVKHALKDKVVYGMNYSIYANQFKRIKIDGDFTKYTNGGYITYINLVDRIGSSQQMEQIVRYAIKNHCEHFTINYSYNRCDNEHITISGYQR